MIERHRARIGDVELAYQTAGAGEPLVLVHGLSGSARWWRHNIPALAQHFRLYLVDLLGFGDSRGRAGFVLDEAAGLLAAWMRLVALPRASVVGHSMGGVIAADLAATFPDLVERLVLVDAPALPLGQGYLRHARGLLGALRHARPGFLPVLLSDAYRAGLWTIAGAARQLLAAHVDARLGDIRAPTLLVWGELDRLVPLATGQQLQRTLGARMVVIAGAGHNPMWDRPAEFNRSLLAFLADDRPEGGTPAPA